MQVWGTGFRFSAPTEKAEHGCANPGQGRWTTGAGWSATLARKKIRTQFNAKPCVKEIRWSGGGVIHL